VGIADAPQPADAENAGETAPAAAAPAPFQPELDPRHAEVYALADQGQSAYDIANQLGRPRGEIELILALRPRG
jgi:DNA-binding NarL/FixJ family response regulator